MKYFSFVILLCLTVVLCKQHSHQHQQEQFDGETYNDAYNNDEQDPTQIDSQQQALEQQSSSNEEPYQLNQVQQPQQYNQPSDEVPKALAHSLNQQDKKNIKVSGSSNMNSIAKQHESKFKPFLNLKSNINLEIRKITEEQLKQELNREQKNLTFNQFLHELRSFYQQNNYSSEQGDKRSIEEFWTKPKSLVQTDAPPQQNRTNQDKMLTVHVIAHSHQDAGWRKTVDEYFTGSNKNQDSSHVKAILDGVTDELTRNSNRKFTIVDIKFFSMWYKNLDANKKKLVKNLIQNGQLEITQGGWVSTDEACPNYEDMILNMQMGHSFLQKEFGVRPRVGWMVDAFGHSASNAALFSDFGFDAIFMSREPNEGRIKRAMDGELQFIWKPFSKHFGDAKEIFAHFFWSHYTAPDDTLHNDIDRTGEDAFQFDSNMPDYNALKKVHNMINHVQTMTKMYPAKQNIAVLIGDDFGYPDAYDTFKTNDQFLELANKWQQRNMTFVYSTPSAFIDAVNKEKVTWPVYDNDFFPYFEQRYEFWTGYYTSRPGIKKQAKSYSQLFHAQSRVFARRMINNESTDSDIQNALAAYWKSLDQLSITQHHDAITGTSSQYVATYYSHMLFQSFKNSKQELSNDLSRKVRQLANIEVQPQGLETCHDFMQNDTIINCPLEKDKDSKEFLVVVYNQNTQQKDHLIRILLLSPFYRAELWDSKEQKFKDVDFDIFEQKHYNKEGGNFEDQVMYLKASIDVDQIALVKIIKTENANVAGQPIQEDKAAKTNKSLSLQGVSDGYVTFKYINKEQGIHQNFGVNIKKYLAAQMHNITNIQQSTDQRDYLKFLDIERLQMQFGEGAYVFQPAWDEPSPKQFSQINEDAFYQNGKFLEQWTFNFEDPKSEEKAKLRVRFSEFFDEMIEFDVELSPLPLTDGRDKDVTVNFKMFNGFDPVGQFWSDQNGLEMQEHHIEYIPSNYTFLNNKSYPNYHMVSGNFVPVETAIMMRDQNQSNIQVTVMNDRTQAGSADLTDKATIELMQQRRIQQDDQKGLSEGMNETERNDERPPRITARYYMQIFDFKQGQSKLRQQQIKLQQPLQYFFASEHSFHQKPIDNPKGNNVSSVIGLYKLPQTVTYRMFPIEKNQILIRFENLADLIDGNIEASKTQYINIEQLVDDLYYEENKVKPSNYEIIEMSLQGVYPLDIEKRKEWVTVEDKQSELYQLAQDQDGFKGIALEPQRMRTFKITYNQPAEIMKAQIADKDKIKKQMAMQKFAIKDMIMLNSQKYNY